MIVARLRSISLPHANPHNAQLLLAQDRRAIALHLPRPVTGACIAPHARRTKSPKNKKPPGEPCTMAEVPAGPFLPSMVCPELKPGF